MNPVLSGDALGLFISSQETRFKGERA